LTIEATMSALETAYKDLAISEAVCRPRIDIRIPTSDPKKNYQWGTMEGGSTAGYFAIRMKSDIIYEQTYNGATTQEKYCTTPGLFCGLILLTSIENGEPLAFVNDGVLQHMRVAGDGGIGVKYLSNPDSEVVGMLGSGGMSRDHMKAFTAVRDIKKLQVFSPTKANREAFGEEMHRKYNIEVQVVDSPEKVYRGAHIVAGLTDSAIPVLDGSLLEKGAHIVNIGGGGLPDEKSIARVDVYLRFGDAPAPVAHPELQVPDSFIAWEARQSSKKFGDGRNANGRAKAHAKAHGSEAVPSGRRVSLVDLLSGKEKGRTSADQITWSERGNLQGVQFYAVAGHVYELAKKQGLGHEIPTSLFLQDIRN
jgi:alanine dehydrogenase